WRVELGSRDERMLGRFRARGRVEERYAWNYNEDPCLVWGNEAGVVPLGVTGNTPDSGSGESWFDPRRGNSMPSARLASVRDLLFSAPVIVSACVVKG